MRQANHPLPGKPGPVAPQGNCWPAARSSAGVVLGESDRAGLAGHLAPVDGGQPGSPTLSVVRPKLSVVRPGLSTCLAWPYMRWGCRCTGIAGWRRGADMGAFEVHRYVEIGRCVVADRVVDVQSLECLSVDRPGGDCDVRGPAPQTVPRVLRQSAGTRAAPHWGWPEQFGCHCPQASCVSYALRREPGHLPVLKLHAFRGQLARRGSADRQTALRSNHTRVSD
jgi:hypothetical protein